MIIRKTISEYFFKPVSAQRQQSMHPLLDILLQNPQSTLSSMKFEISVALLFNCAVLCLAKYCIFDTLREHLHCNLALPVWLILHCVANLVSVFPKLLILANMRRIQYLSDSVEVLRENLQNFFVTRIYYLNSVVSKTILLLYGVGLLLSLYYKYFSDSVHAECHAVIETSLSIVIAFIARLGLSILKSQMQQQRQQGIPLESIEIMRKQELTAEQCHRLQKHNHICSICLEGYT